MRRLEQHLAQRLRQFEPDHQTPLGREPPIERWVIGTLALLGISRGDLSPVGEADQPGAGRSATAAAAYRSAELVHDVSSDEVFDYTRKRGVEHTEIVLPATAAKLDINWARDRQALWNAAEVAENRSNSRVAREYEIALPHELNRGAAGGAGAGVCRGDRGPVRGGGGLCDSCPASVRGMSEITMRI